MRKRRSLRESVEETGKGEKMKRKGMRKTEGEAGEQAKCQKRFPRREYSWVFCQVPVDHDDKS